MESLIREHVRCESLLASAQGAFARAEWPAFRVQMVQLRDVLLSHFASEEEAVFPEFERQTGLQEPTLELRVQHQRMREILEALASASPAHDSEGCGAELATLAALFRQHREAEEGAMYPAFRDVFNPTPVSTATPVALPALDLRGLEPPQPMVRIFEALKRAPGEPLRVVLPHEPHPLYGLLREQGFEWSGASRADGGFELTIRAAHR